MRRDPLIIGAGPAGTAAAITLAQAGFHPVLMERATGPSDKVCGDFLSVDTIQRAQTLGVDPICMGAAPIHRIRLISGEHIAESPLPFPAFGLSRRTLDAALLARAVDAGAIVRTGQTVRHLTWDAGRWSTQMGDQTTMVAETVFLATGKHDLRDHPRPGSTRGAVGMKMYFSLAPGPADALTGAIELTLFPGGYAGMQHIEGGRSVLCVAVGRQALQRHGGNWASLLQAIQQRSRHFKDMLAGATALLPRALAIAGVPYGYQAGAVSSDGLFRLGDQAAVIPSLTGDGLAIALHSGTTAAESWLAGADSTSYHRALTRILKPRMHLAGLLHHALMSPPIQSATVRATALFPGLLRQAARHTRLPLRAEPVGQAIPT